MTRVILLTELKKRCEEATANIILPTAIQKGDTEEEKRAPEVYKMRLTNSRDAKKLAPYIIVQFVSGIDKQPHGKLSDSNALVRFIFCVYSNDEEQGATALLNVMDAVRLSLLKEPIIGKTFKLDTDAGLESLVYPDDTEPYFAGEMVGTFILPPIEREVSLNG